MNAFIGIDLDAPAREGAFPEGIPIRRGGRDFILPAELPIDVFDPLLAEDFDLTGLITALTSSQTANFGEAIVEVLTSRPDLPRTFIDTIYKSFELLFGAEQFAEFQKTRPGIPTYSYLVRGLFEVYGTTLGEAFASPEQSEDDGATQKPTSSASISSTSEASTDAPASAPATSEFVDSQA